MITMVTLKSVWVFELCFVEAVFECYSIDGHMITARRAWPIFLSMSKYHYINDHNGHTEKCVGV